MKVDTYEKVFEAIVLDPRYQRNLDWGRPRKGHPEATIRAHIEELEANLQRLAPRLTDDEQWKIRLAIHVHDTFKPNAKIGAPIWHRESHASLARQFLAEYCHDVALLTTVQLHDEHYAIWRKLPYQDHQPNERFSSYVAAIFDWDLHLGFVIVDGCTRGKSRSPLVWLFEQLTDRVDTRFTVEDLL